MGEFWGVLFALAVIVVPLALAGWLLGRAEGRRGDRAAGRRPRGKMPPP